MLLGIVVAVGDGMPVDGCEADDDDRRRTGVEGKPGDRRRIGAGRTLSAAAGGRRTEN